MSVQETAKPKSATRAEFCESEGMSLSFYYKMRRMGLGPDELCPRHRISADHAGSSRCMARGNGRISQDRGGRTRTRTAARTTAPCRQGGSCLAQTRFPSSYRPEELMMRHLGAEPVAETSVFTNCGKTETPETPMKSAKARLTRVPFKVSRLMEFCNRRELPDRTPRIRVAAGRP
jgi:hypothetical protein